MNITRRDALKKTALLGAAATFAPGLMTRGQGGNAANGLTLPDLPYAYDALEPAIDARTMRIHHGKHHAGYVRKYNAAAGQLSGSPSLNGILGRLKEMPEELRSSLRNNGGGAYNHTLFWESMSPVGKGGGGMPTGTLAARLRKDFGSVENFKKEFSLAAGSVFGSGWAWLIERKADGKLAVVSTPNQDNPLMASVVEDGKTGRPLLNLDVWEHAYYLHYQNRRGDYISNWWKIVNWDAVSDRTG